MAYKKFVKREGKIFGPYYYESYRGKDGKVKKKYVGTINPDVKKKGNSKKKIGGDFSRLKKGLLVSLIVVFGVLFLAVAFRGITANVVSDVVGEEVVLEFNKEVVDLEIREPVVFGGDVLNKNKNKRMDFDLGDGNLRLYFDLINYSEVADGVGSQEERVGITGNLIRRLTGFVVVDELIVGHEKPKGDVGKRAKKFKRQGYKL